MNFKQYLIESYLESISPEQLERFRDNLKVGDKVALEAPESMKHIASVSGMPGLYDDITIVKIHKDHLGGGYYNLVNHKYQDKDKSGQATWSFMRREQLYPTKAWVFKQTLSPQTRNTFGDLIDEL